MARSPKTAQHNRHEGRKPKSWAEQRKGFKQELILTVRVLGFSIRRAEHIIEAALDAIVEALQRGEDVTVEDFGVWRGCATPQRRGWRFGKVVMFKPHKVVFEPDNAPYSVLGILIGPVMLLAKEQTEAPEPE